MVYTEILSIYKSIVRAHLEYCTPAWSPHYRKDNDLLERVQHRFTRMFSHLRHLEYEKRLNILGLLSLEERRNRADLLEVYKMASGKSGNSLHDLLTVDKNGKTRGHSLKLIKTFSKGNTRHHFFTRLEIEFFTTSSSVCSIYQRFQRSSDKDTQHEDGLLQGLLIR